MSAMPRVHRPPVAHEVEWWRKRVVKLAGVVGALAVLFGPVIAVKTWFDGTYAQAADVQQIQVDVLELRRDSLAVERRDLLRAQRQRRLTDPEVERLDKVNELIRGIDRRLDALQQRPKK